MHRQIPFVLLHACLAAGMTLSSRWEPPLQRNADAIPKPIIVSARTASLDQLRQHNCACIDRLARWAAITIQLPNMLVKEGTKTQGADATDAATAGKHICIAGAGIGGTCLAVALEKACKDSSISPLPKIELFERDASSSARQGVGYSFNLRDHQDTGSGGLKVYMYTASSRNSKCESFSQNLDLNNGSWAAKNGTI